MELITSNSNTFGISMNFIYIALVIVIMGGLYLYKKLKSTK
ncbi:MAG: hypothetical protein RR500_10060 [Bacilli bacterium]